MTFPCGLVCAHALTKGLQSDLVELDLTNSGMIPSRSATSSYETIMQLWITRHKEKYVWYNSNVLICSKIVKLSKRVWLHTKGPG